MEDAFNVCFIFTNTKEKKKEKSGITICKYVKKSNKKNNDHGNTQHVFYPYKH